MGRSYEQLSLEERCTIARLHEDGQSIRQIAASVDRAASTILRELKRNTGRQVGYKPVHADEQAWARRWRGSRMERQPDLQRTVLDRLAMGWSPEQIAGRLARDQGSTVIGAESIYRFIYAQIRRTNDYAWRRYLPRGKSKRGWTPRAKTGLGHIENRVSMDQRPACVEKRRQIGHWEADLLHPRKSGAAILVLHERSSRYTLLAKQPGKHAAPIAQRLKEWFAAMPKRLRRTLTHDNGPEFSLHHRLHDTGLKTYFCDPHSPWQKGSVENTNGRLRRYIPRGTNPDSFSDRDLQALAQILNDTPRKCLGFKTPAEVLLQKPLHFKWESTSRYPPG
jgi:IS30 family transposase